MPFSRLNAAARVAALCFVSALIMLPAPRAARASGQPNIAPEFIVFGYAQDMNRLQCIRWNALTHITGGFTEITAAGGFSNLSSSFTNRNALLRSGGAAQAAGVKVVMCVNSFDDAPGGIIETVMTSSTLRQNLITNIKNAVEGDAYCAGVNFDFEFSWGSTVRNGMSQFLRDLRAQLDADKEMSIYVNAFYSASQWNAPALAETCDYILQSGYDYATGTTPRAITNQSSNLGALAGWFAAGIPPEKMVYTLSAYGGEWVGSSQYNVNSGSARLSMGFTDGLWNTTLRTTNGGPFAPNYVRGAESAWYTYTNNSAQPVVGTWDSVATLEYKMRSARSFQGAGAFQGRRLRGVGFWSLMWMTENGGYDPIRGLGGTGSNFMRTYPHLFQKMNEVFGPAGTRSRVLENFEALNPHWDDLAGGATGTPAPANINMSSAGTARSATPIPAGAGRPPYSTNGLRVVYQSTARPARLFMRHEPRASDVQTGTLDTHDALAKVPATTRLSCYVHAAGAYANTTVRLVVFDANREVEMGPPMAVASGWQTLSWDLGSTAPGNVTALASGEPLLMAGDGLIDSTGAADDIGVMGFMIEQGAGAPALGTLFFDDLSADAAPATAIVINEFRYNPVGGEFVEIAATPGTVLPANLQLRGIDGTDSDVLTTVALGGLAVPANGLLVIGDAGVPNVNVVPPNWSAGVRDLPATVPGGLQLFDTVNKRVYDSVVYRAMGSTLDLVRAENLGITEEGGPWCGEVGTGTNAAGERYTLGRYPDGHDTERNFSDFAAQPPTPGTANGAPGVFGATANFDSLPADLLQTYQLPRSVAPASAGLPASAGGGNVLRVVDTTGGGTQAFWGDDSLGAANGYSLTGEFYIAASGAPEQACAVGICGRQGSNFFATTNARNAGYESGYWLIYEQGATVDLNDGQPNHGGSFQFVMAQNDAQTSVPTAALGTTRTLASLGLAPNTWASFQLSVRPSTNELIARVNGQPIYNGPVPAGGPTAGAIQIGFRETDGTISATEGTWVDSLAVSPGVPVGLARLAIE